MNRKITAALLIAAAVTANVAFTALGTVFNYPDVLKEPTADILGAFRANQTTVSVWFTVLALSAALFAPIAIGVGRLSTHRAMRVAVPVAMAAAAVQVIGLMRWPLLVPGYAADAASPDSAVAASGVRSFELAHRVLGNLIGETFGYLLTAAWTLLVLVALRRAVAGRWFTTLGATAAVLVLAGVLSPLNLPLVDLANFAGYVLWSLWLVAFAVLLLRRARLTTTVPSVHSPLAGGQVKPGVHQRGIQFTSTKAVGLRSRPSAGEGEHSRHRHGVAFLDGHDASLHRRDERQKGRPGAQMPT